MVTKIVLWCLIFVAVASILKPAPNSFDSKMWIIGNPKHSLSNCC
jgi:hypothetical protein